MKKFDADPVVYENDLDHYVRLRRIFGIEIVPTLALVRILSLS